MVWQCDVRCLLDYYFLRGVLVCCVVSGDVAMYSEVKESRWFPT